MQDRLAAPVRPCKAPHSSLAALQTTRSATAISTALRSHDSGPLRGGLPQPGARGRLQARRVGAAAHRCAALGVPQHVEAATKGHGAPRPPPADLGAACRAGAAALLGGGDALAAVTAAIKVLEASGASDGCMQLAEAGAGTPWLGNWPPTRPPAPTRALHSGRCRCPQGSAAASQCSTLACCVPHLPPNRTPAGQPARQCRPRIQPIYQRPGGVRCKRDGRGWRVWRHCRRTRQARQRQALCHFVTLFCSVRHVTTCEYSIPPPPTHVHLALTPQASRTQRRRQLQWHVRAACRCRTAECDPCECAWCPVLSYLCLRLCDARQIGSWDSLLASREASRLPGGAGTRVSCGQLHAHAAMFPGASFHHWLPTECAPASPPRLLPCQDAGWRSGTGVGSVSWPRGSRQLRCGGQLAPDRSLAAAVAQVP